MNLHPGAYYGKLIDAGLGEIGQNGTPAMCLTFEITHQARDGQWEGMEPITRDATFFLTEKSREFSFNDLFALGFNGDMDAPRFAADLYEGAELVMHQEVYNNKTQERWTLAKLRRGADRKPVAVEVKRTLAALYRTVASASAKPVTPPPPPPRAAGQAPAAASSPSAFAAGAVPAPAPAAPAAARAAAPRPAGSSDDAPPF